LGFDGGGKEKIIEKFCEIIPFDENSQKNLLNQIGMLQSKDEIIEFLSNIAVSLERKKEEEAGLETARYVAKVVFLSVIDNLWMEHLTTMEDLRVGISLRGYGQRNPLIEYKNESFKIFEQMMHSIDNELLYRFFRVNFLSVVRPQERTNLVVNKPESEISQDSLSEKPTKKGKLGRNDPCWCGSGKKFKKCHWPKYG
jgi:preprotein translocase subunit SecA